MQYQYLFLIIYITFLKLILQPIYEIPLLYLETIMILINFINRQLHPQKTNGQPQLIITNMELTVQQNLYIQFILILILVPILSNIDSFLELFIHNKYSYLFILALQFILFKSIHHLMFNFYERMILSALCFLFI